MPINDAVSPTPKANSFPAAETADDTARRKQAEDNAATKKAIQDSLGQLTGVASAIAALTPAIQGLPDAIANNPNVRAANRDDVQGAVCEISQPTGCLGAPIKKAEDAANANGTKIDGINDKLNALGLAGQGVDLGLLTIINNKLGDQVPGGIAGKLTRFTQWLQLDRALNVLIFVATVQNHLMLSRDIGTTLLSAFSNGLSLIGLKDDSGQSFDLGSIISSSVENIVKGIVGTDNYTTLTETWAKANRIYQATNNVINSFQNISNAILGGMELIGSYTGKIGNALKKGGEVLDNAYGWMNPQPKFNRISQGLEKLNQGASTIQQVTQAPLDVVNAVTELQTANTELIKSFKEDDKPENNSTPIPEPDKLKADELAAKLNSRISNILPDDLFNAAD
ncbi:MULTISPECIES: hypothetical protein [unclassified Nostoc]|uniref:hypothetical protein n=1 Tax=unclassified Nostoc TaxID=2593658 RepID=UPI002AD41593|nr:hypothetical protein [Nostoc sp. DedQUE03]MDZ7975758.1 hypothetical protein [Nostoc sp. DedQUE03]MDZ8048290.1 hypothetical protein [Nostoc sp. DedQUE02]